MGNYKFIEPGRFDEDGETEEQYQEFKKLYQTLDDPNNISRKGQAWKKINEFFGKTNLKERLIRKKVIESFLSGENWKEELEARFVMKLFSGDK